MMTSPLLLALWLSQATVPPAAPSPSVSVPEAPAAVAPAPAPRAQAPARPAPRARTARARAAAVQSSAQGQVKAARTAPAAKASAATDAPTSLSAAKAPAAKRAPAKALATKGTAAKDAAAKGVAQKRSTPKPTSAGTPAVAAAPTPATSWTADAPEPTVGAASPSHFLVTPLASRPSPFAEPEEAPPRVLRLSTRASNGAQGRAMPLRGEPPPPGFLLREVTPGKHLRTDAARAFVRMQKAARRSGVRLEVFSSFRTKGQQRELYTLFRTGKGAPAAQPGSSMHERGLAVDVILGGRATPVEQWLESWACHWGFARTVPGEPWHFEFRPTLARPPAKGTDCTGRALDAPRVAATPTAPAAS